VRHVKKIVKVRNQPETFLNEIQSTQPLKLVRRRTFNLIYKTITHIKLENRKIYIEVSLIFKFNYQKRGTTPSLRIKTCFLLNVYKLKILSLLTWIQISPKIDLNLLENEGK
jgi:hypothetical protein